MFTIDDKHFRLFEVILAPRKTGKSADSIRLETNELIRQKVTRYNYTKQVNEQMLVLCRKSERLMINHRKFPLFP